MMRGRTKKRLGFGAAALAVACAVATPAFADKADNSVRFASQETLPNIDPYFNNVRIGTILADQVWDTLIYSDPQTGEYKGNLAAAWRWVDEKTLELDLRQGVKFHNGAEFDADDVAHTLDFVSKPQNKALGFYRLRWIDRVEILGKFKLRIVAKGPFPAAIAFLAAPSSVIHPRDYYAKVGPKGMNEKPIGTGPFRVVEYTLGKAIGLAPNPNYFKDSPKSQPRIGRVEIRFISDAQTRVAEMLAGGLDLIMNVSPDQAEQLRGVQNLQIVSGETMRYSYLAMNTTPRSSAPQLRDIRVRQAIMHAIDRETMVKFLVGNGSRVLHAECHPRQFGCDDANVPRYAYDPRKAKQLLAEAGFGNGLDIDIYAYRDRTHTEAIIGYLGAVGIQAHLRFLQYPAIVSAIPSGKAALVHLYWGSDSVNDVAASVSRFHEFSSDDMNRDPEIRDLLLRGDTSMDPNVRKDAYAKALALIAERAYVLPLYSVPTYYLAAKDLAFKPHPDEIPRFYEMSYR